jgi:phosphoribosyl-dephospho-CoA transferase
VVTGLQVHDLARVDPCVANTWSDAPLWVAESLQRAPWVVVRRERAELTIPVGIRGRERSLRFAASVAPADILETVSPTELGEAIASIERQPNARLAAAFCALADFAATQQLRVAPIGSYGFELASGVRVTHDASDLDVLVASARVSRRTLEALSSYIEVLTLQTGVRIDAELSFPMGSAMIDEILGGRCMVLFKTASGPRLLECPV